MGGNCPLAPPCSYPSDIISELYSTADVFCDCNHAAIGCKRLHIFCMDHDTNICLKTGECITYDNETANLGWCPYYPKHLAKGRYCSAPLKVHLKLPVNLTQLTNYFCGDYNREGPLCSKCIRLDMVLLCMPLALCV